MSEGGDAGAVPEEAAPASYAEALRERLKLVAEEVEGQGASAIALRHSVEAAWNETEVSGRELARLRARWSAEQAGREAFLKETGEAERRLADRERHCAELLQAHAAAELEKMSYRCGSIKEETSPDGAREAPAAEEADPTSPGDASSGAKDEDAPVAEGTLPPAESAVRPGTSRLASGARQLVEHRQRLATFERSRSQLTQALQDLRDASRQEAAGLGQLQQRCEALRRESQSLKAANAAAHESEASRQRKLEALDNTAPASHQREQGMERTVAELRTEVQNLRSELSESTAASAAAAIASAAGPALAPSGGAHGAVAKSAEEVEAATWATNRLLQVKVLALQDELQRRRNRVQELRLRASTQA